MKLRKNEESGVGDKFNDKNKKQVDANEKNAPLYQNIESLVLLPKRQKLSLKKKVGGLALALE